MICSAYRYRSNIRNKDTISYKIHTKAPKEFDLPENARIRWKVTPLKGRKYNFIIGIDLLNFLNAFIDVERKLIKLNQKESKFVNNPYAVHEICILEQSNEERLNLNHLNTEEHKEVTKIIKRFEKLFFKEGDKLTSH